MSTTTHTIHPVTSADLPALIQNLYESKLALPINRLLWKYWPNEPVQRAQYTKAIESSFQNPACEQFKVVDDESGEIVGQLNLTRKEPVIDEVKKLGAGDGDGKENAPEGINEEIFREVMRFTNEVHTMKEVEHFELTYISVKPNYRRQGIGLHLVKLAIEKVEKEGIPLSVGVEPEAHEFFLAQGFKDLKHVDIDLRQWAAQYSGFGVFRFYGMVLKK